MSTVIGINRKTKIGFLLSFFLLLVSYAFIYFISDQQIKRSGEIIRANATLNELEIIKSRLIDAETGVRGYVITSDPRFLKYYYSGEKNILPAYDSLQQLTASDSALQPYILNLRRMVVERLNSLTKTKNDFQQSHRITAPLRHNKEINENLMDSIRVIFDVLQNKKSIDKNAAFEKYQNFIRSTRQLIVFSFILAILTLAYSLRIYYKENRQHQFARGRILYYKDVLRSKLEENKVLQSQLSGIQERQSEPSILTKNIVHDVRNPLANISLANDQIISKDNSTEDIGTLHTLIRNNVEHINKLITGLLSQNAGEEVWETNKYDINQIVEGALARASDRITLKEVRVVKSLSENLPLISVDGNKMESAILNFILNSIEAMPTGKGILLVSTCLKMNTVIISIEDNGCGMEELTVKKIFQPYFSRKKNGMGVGMASAQYIIQRYKGKIKVKSKKGKGTQVVVFLNI